MNFKPGASSSSPFTRQSTNKPSFQDDEFGSPQALRTTGSAAVFADVSRSAITDAERAEFKEMFDFCKKENNNKDTRDRQELKYLMDILRLNPTEAELDAMMYEVDTDGSGDVDFDEFVDVMSRTTEFDLPSSKLRASFKLFEDEQKEGFCSTELLRSAILYHCKDELRNPSDSEYEVDDWDEAGYLLSKLDPSSTGMIKIEDIMSVIVQSENAIADLKKKEKEEAENNVGNNKDSKNGGDQGENNNSSSLGNKSSTNHPSFWDDQ